MRNYLTSVAIYGVIGTILGLALGILLGNCWSTSLAMCSRWILAR